MRIVLDLQSCQSGSQFGGIGRYSLELAKAMIRLAPEDEFLIILNDRNPDAVRRIRREFRDLLPPDNFRVFAVPDACFYLHDDGAVAGAAELIREQFIVDLRPDFVHVTSLFEGFLDKVVTSVRRSDASIPTAVTLYDLIPIAQKELYLQDARAAEHYFDKFDQLKQADVLLAISDFSAQEGMRLIDDFKGIVADIRGGIDDIFAIIPNAKARIDEFLRRKEISDRFILYTASFDQRKNHRRLVEAFATLPVMVRKSLQLVIVGDGWPAVYHDLRMTASDLGLSQRDIVFAGRVSDEELICLYNTCALFVFPSLWEGLGMPVLEAMACGAPVVGSNTTSLPEVIGWDKATFNPNDAASIAAKIEQALTNQSFYDQLKAHAAQHVKQFSWAESALRSLTAIREAHVRIQANAERQGNIAQSTAFPRAQLAKRLRERRYSEQQIWEFACCLAANELEADVLGVAAPEIKLGWVTTWGTRCGIASYSANLVRVLKRNIAILAPEVEGAELHNTDDVSRCWTQGKIDELYQLAQRIDELELTDIVIQFNFGFFNFEAFNVFVEKQVLKGRRIYVTLHSTSDTMELYGHRLLDLDRALAVSTAVIVHTEQDVVRLAEMGISRNVVQITQGVRLLENCARRLSRARLRIASYGFFLPNKGLPELIEALAIIRNAGHDVELQMVNANYGDDHGVSTAEIEAAKALAGRLGVTDSVDFITDYLDDTESLERLREADLVVYAYQRTGESSSAAVRMGLASGTPVAVTPLEIFDDVAQATFRLPGVAPTEVAAGIIEILDNLKSDLESVELRAAQAAAWCVSHEVGSVGARLMRLIEREAATEVWRAVPLPSVTNLPTRDGLVENDTLRSVRAQGGLLSHGPYINLEEGLYRLIVHGAAVSGLAGRVGKIRITHQCGDKQIDQFDLSEVEGSVILDRMINVDKYADQVEFIISYDIGAKLTLSGYQLLQRISHA